MFPITTVQEAETEMPRFDLEGARTVKLIVTAETSQRIAELRAHFRDTGREQDSLAYVVDQAVLSLHSSIFSVASRPNDANHFLKTDSKPVN